MSQAEVFQKKLIKAREENDGFEKSKLVDQAELAVIYKPEPHGMRLVGCALVKQETKEE